MHIERIFLVITYVKEVPIQRVCDFGCSSYVCMCQSLCSRAGSINRMQFIYDTEHTTA